MTFKLRLGVGTITGAAGVQNAQGNNRCHQNENNQGNRNPAVSLIAGKGCIGASAGSCVHGFPPCLLELP
jgi:hypothetical protein